MGAVHVTVKGNQLSCMIKQAGMCMFQTASGR